jgi:MFS family permease
MSAGHDRWGEPIVSVRRTFSLATLFRLLTIVAGLSGWLSVVRLSMAAAGWVLLGVALTLAMVAIRRFRGRWGRRGLVGALFLLGFPPVALYLAMISFIVVTPAWIEAPPDTQIALLIEACFAIAALPGIAVVGGVLLKTWLHLAADEAERRA